MNMVYEWFRTQEGPGVALHNAYELIWPGLPKDRRHSGWPALQLGACPGECPEWICIEDAFSVRVWLQWARSDPWYRRNAINFWC